QFGPNVNVAVTGGRRRRWPRIATKTTLRRLRSVAGLAAADHGGRGSQLRVQPGGLLGRITPGGRLQWARSATARTPRVALGTTAPWRPSSGAAEDRNLGYVDATVELYADGRGGGGSQPPRTRRRLRQELAVAVLGG